MISSDYQDVDAQNKIQNFSNKKLGTSRKLLNATLEEVLKHVVMGGKEFGYSEMLILTVFLERSEYQEFDEATKS